MAQQYRKQIATKQINYKMTPEEVQDLLKIRNQGGGVTRNKKAYTRKEKYKKSYL